MSSAQYHAVPAEPIPDGDLPPALSKRGRPNPSVWHRFTQDKAAMVALVFLVVVFVTTYFANLLPLQNPNQQNLADRYEGYSWHHLLGTDSFGRDVLSRLVHGGAVTLTASFEALAIAVLLGVPAGLLAGYLGGWFDAVYSRIIDAVMCVPPILLALAIVAILANNLTHLMVAIGIVISPQFFRLARASTKNVRSETYIEASRSIGCRTRRIILRHVLPNMVSPIIVQAYFAIGFAILAEASFSYLGIGVQPPQSSWGSILQTAANDIYNQRWEIVAPGLMIILTVLAFTTCGDALRDAMRTTPHGESS